MCPDTQLHNMTSLPDIHAKPASSGWADAVNEPDGGFPETGEEDNQTYDSIATLDTLGSLPLHMVLPRPARPSVSSYINTRYQVDKSAPNGQEVSSRVEAAAREAANSKPAHRPVRRPRKKKKKSVAIDIAEQVKAIPKKAGVFRQKRRQKKVVKPEDPAPKLDLEGGGGQLWGDTDGIALQFLREQSQQRSPRAADDDFSEIARPKPRSWLRNTRVDTSQYQTVYDPGQMTRKVVARRHHEFSTQTTSRGVQPRDTTQASQAVVTPFFTLAQRCDETRELNEALQYVYKKLSPKEPGPKPDISVNVRNAAKASAERKSPPKAKDNDGDDDDDDWGDDDEYGDDDDDDYGDDDDDGDKVKPPEEVKTAENAEEKAAEGEKQEEKKAEEKAEDDGSGDDYGSGDFGDSYGEDDFGSDSDADKAAPMANAVGATKQEEKKEDATAADDDDDDYGDDDDDYGDDDYDDDE